MDLSALLSGNMIWWLAGAALVLVLLLAPRLRRPATHDDHGAGASPGTDSSPAACSADDAQWSAPPVAAATDVPGDADIGRHGETGSSAVDGEEMNNALRLEMARVYLELGDAAGAEAMLTQVAASGDDEQRAAAADMRREMVAAGDTPAVETVQADAENLLDLATAYVEIGDEASARRMADKIEKVGTAEQCRQAQRLLERL